MSELEKILAETMAEHSLSDEEAAKFMETHTEEEPEDIEIEVADLINTLRNIATSLIEFRDEGHARDKQISTLIDKVDAMDARLSDIEQKLESRIQQSEENMMDLLRQLTMDMVSNMSKLAAPAQSPASQPAPVKEKIPMDQLRADPPAEESSKGGLKILSDANSMVRPRQGSVPPEVKQTSRIILINKDASGKLRATGQLKTDSDILRSKTEEDSDIRSRPTEEPTSPESSQVSPEAKIPEGSEKKSKPTLKAPLSKPKPKVADDEGLTILSKKAAEEPTKEGSDQDVKIAKPVKNHSGDVPLADVVKRCQKQVFKFKITCSQLAQTSCIPGTKMPLPEEVVSLVSNRSNRMLQESMNVHNTGLAKAQAAYKSSSGDAPAETYWEEDSLVGYQDLRTKWFIEQVLDPAEEMIRQMERDECLLLLDILCREMEMARISADVGMTRFDPQHHEIDGGEPIPQGSGKTLLIAEVRKAGYLDTVSGKPVRRALVTVSSS